MENSRRWTRIAVLLALAAVVSFIGRLVLEWVVSLVPNHPVLAERVVATIFVCVLVIFVVKPILEELGVVQNSKESSKPNADGEP
ncbi:hypothetical protein [Roseateles sp.]|uniref:hypothetical protein n=1 Tax=Roseateles sp. TaxID=1971397 RepID=UPI00286ACD5B|nr:hypothetical protein [Roseateles sp.]